MSAGFLVLVLISIVETEPLVLLVTKAVLPSGVIASRIGPVPTAMSVGLLVLVFTSMVDTVPLAALVTNAVLPSGVTATWTGPEPTAMSVGFLIPVVASIVDTVSLDSFATKTVARHRARAGTADTPPGATSAPANPSTSTPGTHWNRRIEPPASPCSPAPSGLPAQRRSHSGVANRKTGNQQRDNGMSNRNAPSRGADSMDSSRDSH